MQYFPNLKQGDPINRRWFNDLIGFCNSLVLRGDGRTTRVNRTASGTTVSTISQPVAAGGSGGGGGGAGVEWWNIVEQTGDLTVTIQHPGQNAATLPVITFPTGTASYFVAYFRTTDRENTAGTYPKPEAAPHELYAYFAAGGSGNPDALNFDLIHGVEVQILAFVSISGSSISRIVQYSSAPQILRTRTVNSFANLDIFPIYNNWNSTPRLVTPADFYCTSFRIRGHIGYTTPVYQGQWGRRSVDSVFQYNADTDYQTIFYHSNDYFSAASGHTTGGGSPTSADAYQGGDITIPVAGYSASGGMITQLWLYEPIPFMLNPDVFNP